MNVTKYTVAKDVIISRSLIYENEEVYIQNPWKLYGSYEDIPLMVFVDKKCIGEITYSFFRSLLENVLMK